MKKEEVKMLKTKLLEALNNVLIDNNYYITKKIEKIVEKSIEKIVQKRGKHISQTTAKI